MKQTVKVEIAGQKLVITSDEGPQYVQALADYVDAQVRTLMAPGGRKTFNLQRVSLLAAIRIADELFREKDLHRRFRTQVDAKLLAVDRALVDHEARIAALAKPETETELGPVPAPSAAGPSHAGDPPD